MLTVQSVVRDNTLYHERSQNWRNNYSFCSGIHVMKQCWNVHYVFPCLIKAVTPAWRLTIYHFIVWSSARNVCWSLYKVYYNTMKLTLVTRFAQLVVMGSWPLFALFGPEAAIDPAMSDLCSAADTDPCKDMTWIWPRPKVVLCMKRTARLHRSVADNQILIGVVLAP